MTYSMLKGLQCIIAILKFSDVRESFTLVRLKIIKHGNPVGDKRIMDLMYYVYSNKSHLSFTSNVIFL